MTRFASKVDTFIDTGSESHAAALVSHARTHALDDSDILYLATSLAHSGTMLAACHSSATDIASTGGPSSLSTLLTPLMLVAAGRVVPKASVPGRPAGAIDVMAQIPKYRTILTENQVVRALSTSGFAHFLAQDTFVPRDGQLYSYRRKSDQVNIPALAIASLLSKKLAVGLMTVGLDVRVAPFGNIGRSWKDARVWAESFCRVSALAGVRARCFLTDGTRPYQPFIGRGEALVALGEVLAGTACPQLRDHYVQCAVMAGRLTGQSLDAFTPAHLEPCFTAHLADQGTCIESFWTAVEDLKNSHTIAMRAEAAGFLHIHLDVLRRALVAMQTQHATPDTDFPDPIGVTLRRTTGDNVSVGDVLCMIRLNGPGVSEAISYIRPAFRIGYDLGATTGFEEITNA